MIGESMYWWLFLHCVDVLDTSICDGNVWSRGQPQSHASYFELMIDASKTPIPIRLELGGEMHLLCMKMCM